MRKTGLQNDVCSVLVKDQADDETDQGPRVLGLVVHEHRTSEPWAQMLILQNGKLLFPMLRRS